jgi:hypothetical protein
MPADAPGHIANKKGEYHRHGGRAGGKDVLKMLLDQQSLAHQSGAEMSGKRATADWLGWT